jgi:hypothetical protein
LHLFKILHGGFSALKKHLLINEECEESIDEAEIFLKNKERVLIVSAEPGSLIILHKTRDKYLQDHHFSGISKTITCLAGISKMIFKQDLAR